MLMKSPLKFENDPGISARKLGSENPRSKTSGLDDADWAERNEYWLKKTPLKSRQFSRRAGVRQVLILSGHGVILRVDHGTLLVQDGFTHYPQKRTTWRFFPGEWRVPSRIVILDANGSLSLDALSWLSRQNISLVQIDWRGEVTSVIGGAGSTDPILVKHQLAARSNGKGVGLSRWFIQSKITNSIETLWRALPRSESVNQALTGAKEALKELALRPPATIGRLLAIEGNAGLAYFKAWRSLPLRWRGTASLPIPDDWLQIGKRASGLNLKLGNRNATHPVNAMLNYGYGWLENQVRMRLVARGLDPAIGYLHANRHTDHGLVLDLMEPLRPLVDRKVLEFVQKESFMPGDFTLLSNGVCRLNPQLARNVVRAIDIAGDVGEVVNRFVSKLHKT